MKRYLLIVLVLIMGLGLGWFWRDSYDPTSLPAPSTTATPAPSIPSSANSLDPNGYVILESPVEGDQITSPLTLRGQAKGSYFFEATFPVVLTDWDGRIIAETFATAQGEWMTEEYVPFSASIDFTKPEYGDRGSLILRRANPSGLPENDTAYEITLYFR